MIGLFVERTVGRLGMQLNNDIGVFLRTVWSHRQRYIIGETIEETLSKRVSNERVTTYFNAFLKIEGNEG